MSNRTTNSRFASRSAEYWAWIGMRQRCENPNHPSYPSYGGRGIRVAAEWHGPQGYTRFLQHVGRKPSPKHSLDRKNNNKNYEPGNVRWAMATEQARNRRDTNYLTFENRTLSFAEWAQIKGLDQDVLRLRLKKLKWDPERALNTPPRKVAKRA